MVERRRCDGGTRFLARYRDPEGMRTGGSLAAKRDITFEVADF